MTTLAALVCFAANSLLCRYALGESLIDAGSFTAVRLLSGAVALWCLAPSSGGRGLVPSVALVAYAACFSLAYREVTAATGALLLFGAVQATMLAGARWMGERLSFRQWCGLALALGGLLYLLSPGLAAPPLGGAALMLVSGAAWGIYSLRGRGSSVARHFSVAAALAVGGRFVIPCTARLTAEGLLIAAISGAVTSALGYVLWFRALRGLSATAAATVQLAVPVIAAAGGTWLLRESFSPRLILSSAVVLAGIGMTLPLFSKRGVECRSVVARCSLRVSRP